MPSEPDLARQLKVSRNTVRAAYATLEAEGLIERRQGRGTFVVSKTARSQKTGEIGLVFFTSPGQMFTIPFYSRLIGQICTRAMAARFHIRLLTHDANLRQFRFDWQEHAAPLEEDIAALAVGVFRPEALKSLSQYKPAVAVDAGGPFDFCDSVAANDFQAGRMATQHLLDLGHRRIGFLGHWQAGPADMIDPSDTHRYEGYCSALSDAGLALEDDLRLEIGTGAAYRVVSAILQAGDGPSAFVGDSIAGVSGMAAALQQGLRVPEDVSFVGMGDAPAGEPGAERLTTVDLHPDQMGQVAVELLQRRLAEPAAPKLHHLADVHLVERKSTGPVAW